jgi:hypothetical protein
MIKRLKAITVIWRLYTDVIPTTLAKDDFPDLCVGGNWFEYDGITYRQGKDYESIKRIYEE